ncbi:Protein of unknown function [Chitinophaga eiseniae]|uniref:DUF4236 domain-containing protein n=1 Tax=Chitinophaga eiseniae TaxID=634771 RepID=A0A1T4PWP5_9BACT|nr:DUF4236 domain-containing protein [Chitinophaga eiseniae]SJZ96004.1 Protein of unknown function [Chitinophaga eiseniae]
MGWSFRKSVGSGLFKVNFSKSGVSYSMGVRGARINLGSRGTYVNLNAHGINYRQKIAGPVYPPPYPGPASGPAEADNNIASADVDTLTDTDSQAFINELNRKSGQVSYLKGAMLPMLLVVVAFLAVSFDKRERTVQPASEEEWYLKNEYLGCELALCMVCFIPLVRWLKKLDRKRFTMELHYDMDDKYLQVYDQFKVHFGTFSRSSKVWQYLNAQRTTDYKRNAGAGKIIRRTGIRGLSGNRMPMPYFITNVAIPCIALHNMELYFLPERLLIKRGSTFAAVFYKNLRLKGQRINFIESEALPADARVVDYTWQYVNRSGGPDRRFNNNRKLPVCAYSEYTFTSDTGIFEIIATSKQSAMDDFAGFIIKIGVLQERIGGSYNNG